MPLMRTLGDASNGRLRVIAVCGNIACRAERELDLAAVIEFVGERHPLVPRLGQAHYSEKLKCPRCKTRGAFVWPKHILEPEPVMAGLSYKVNRWYGGTLMETVAKASSEIIINLAFDACLSHYAGDRLTMQQGMRVIRDSRVGVIEGGKSATG